VRRGQLTWGILFLVLSVILLTIFALAIPIAIDVTTQTYTIGDELIQDAQAATAQISDANVATEINTSLTTATDTTTSNIDFMASLYKYSPYIILVAAVLAVVLLARMRVEAGAGGIA